MSDLEKQLDESIVIGFLYGIQSDFLNDDGVKHRVAGFRHSKGYRKAMNNAQQAFVDDGWVKPQQELSNIIAQSKAELTRLMTAPSTTYRVVGDFTPVQGGQPLEELKTKEEWERQAIKDGWRRCINPKDHAHWLETDAVSSNIRPDFVGPNTVLPRANLSGEQLKAISKEWGKPRMTGQEWYDRFEKEYSTPYVLMGKDGIEGEIRVNPLEAAKKVSGLSND